MLTTLTKFILDIYIEMIISISRPRNYRIFMKRKEKKKILFVQARKSYACKIEKYIVLSYERDHESAQREREREGETKIETRRKKD